MGQGALKRRELLLAGVSTLLAGCDNAADEALQGGWVGASDARGHRLRAPLPAAGDGPLHRAQVLIVGGGVSGLACARALRKAGIDDVALLELEDQMGGNSRGHRISGMACPLGAHYLPLPGPQAREVSELLFDLGLARSELGRTVFDERHLCHSPQERLFYQGQWHEGLLPPALDEATREQYRRFARLVDEAQRSLGFAMPTHRAAWGPGLARLDAQTFAAWLDAQGLSSPPLRWYLDYCCRDDYGAGAAEVSAWAGLHYFASRHGFHPPGDETAEREAVLTWPQGNAWLTERMTAELGTQVIHGGRTVLRVEPGRHQVEVLAWNEAAQAPERWSAQQVVLATPLFIARRLLAQPPAALQAAAAQLQYAPWLVTNLNLRAPLLDRLGVGPAWDNVTYGAQALGYVDAMHQSLRPDSGATVLSAYWALPRAQRGVLLQDPWRAWASRVIAELAQTHPDLPRQLLRADLARWGHAMSIPLPGLRGSTALAALQRPQGRLHFAHSDLAGYSVFEEAYTRGVTAARQLVSSS
jgi:monoamine oxidase